jgi:chromosome segregation ATPase
VLLRLYKLILQERVWALAGLRNSVYMMFKSSSRLEEVTAEMRKLNEQVKTLKSSYVAEETRLQQQQEALSHRDDISWLKDAVGELKGEVASLRTMMQALLEHQGTNCRQTYPGGFS